MKGFKRTKKDTEKQGDQKTYYPDEIHFEGKRIRRYRRQYSENKFLQKIKSVFGLAGKKVVYLALLLYYLLLDGKVPFRTKSIIMGALGYFILPFDLVPDITPIVGFGEDLGILMAVFLEVQRYISSDIRSRARNKVRELFKVEMTDEEFDDFED